MTVFALVDCNNFYASCERAFNPKLKQQPIIILSSNDGCVVARSNEAKALGIKMGAPYFQIKEIVESAKIKVFSSNFGLYGDMSGRIMSILAEFTPELEIYSIDEAFLNLDGFKKLREYTELIRSRVIQWTGIPVSIGVGPTKTIAKLANFIAKKHTTSGVFSLLDPEMRARAYKKIPVEEVWGIGRKISERLNSMRIHTVEDFMGIDSSLLRKEFSIAALKTQNELRGASCIEMEEITPEAKSITSSRSFGRNVTELDDLQASITMHITRIAYKLRQQKLAVRRLQIYAYSNRFAPTSAPWNFSSIVSLPYTTNSTTPLLKIALQGIESIYTKGVLYKKTGVLATELLPEGVYTQDLFTPDEDPKYQKLAIMLDQINAKFGRNQVFHGSLGTSRDWLPKDLLKSRQFTTSLNELLEAF